MLRNAGCSYQGKHTRLHVLFAIYKSSGTNHFREFGRVPRILYILTTYVLTKEKGKNNIAYVSAFQFHTFELSKLNLFQTFRWLTLDNQ